MVFPSEYMMKAQLENETEEDYYDDPIRLFDSELERVYTGSQLFKYVIGPPMTTGDNMHKQLRDFDSEVVTTSDTELNDFRQYDYPPASVKLVDCMKFPWYFKEYRKQILSKSHIYVIDDEDSCDSKGTVIVETDQGNDEIDLDDCIIIDKKVHEEVIQKEKERKELLTQRTLSEKNTTKVDFKRNEGLIGMTVTPKFIPDVMPQVKSYQTINIIDEKVYDRKHDDEPKVSSSKKCHIGRKYEPCSENLNVGYLNGINQEKQINSGKNITNIPNKSLDAHNFSNNKDDLKISPPNRYNNTKLLSCENKNKKRLNQIKSCKKTSNIKKLSKKLPVSSRKQKIKLINTTDISLEPIPSKMTENKVQNSNRPYSKQTTTSNLFKPYNNKEVRYCDEIADRPYANHRNTKNNTVCNDYAIHTHRTRDINNTTVHENYNEKNIKDNLCSYSKQSPASAISCITAACENIADVPVDESLNTSIKTVVARGTVSMNSYNDNQCTTHKQIVITPVATFCNQVNNFSNFINANSTMSPTLQTSDSTKTCNKTNIDLTINKPTTRNQFAAAIILRPNHKQKYSLSQPIGNSEKTIKKALLCPPRLIQNPYLSNNQQIHQGRKPIIKIRPIGIGFLHKNIIYGSNMTEQPRSDILASSQSHPSQSNDKLTIDAQRKSIPHSENIYRENYSMISKDSGIGTAQSMNNGSMGGVGADEQITEAEIALLNKKDKSEMLKLAVPTLQNIFNSQVNNFRQDNTCKTSQDYQIPSLGVMNNPRLGVISLQQNDKDIENELNRRIGNSEHKISAHNVIRKPENGTLPNNLKEKLQYVEEIKHFQPPSSELKTRKSNLDGHITQIWQNSGYSPPILPIPTYKKAIDQVRSKFRSVGGIKNRVVTKHQERFDMYKERKYHESGIKKITLDEYKKRVFNLKNSDVEGKS